MLDYIRLQLNRIITLNTYKRRDWREIPIKENKQPLIKVPNEIAFPFYYHVLKITKTKDLYLREEVLSRVVAVHEFLKKEGFDIRVYDGWRSMELQENLFWYYMQLFTVEKVGLEKYFEEANSFKDVKNIYHNLSSDKKKLLFEANRTYVSWPTKDLSSLSPHATGGAVDVWLYRGTEAENLGVPFDWMKEDAGAFYHLKIKRKKFVGNDVRISKNRSILLLSMIRKGFTCYGPEVWHFNFGNQMDALVKGGHACYSYIEP